MKRRRRRVKKYIKLLILILLIFIILFIIFKLVSKPKEPEKILMLDVTNKEIKEVNKELEQYNLDIEIEYKYDNNIEKDHVISQSIDKDKEIKENDKLTLVVSLGKIDKEKLKNDGINELGKVPVMMYHGIIDKKNSETPYTGGNVDKDGYSRTVEAFRNDLEFYYEKGYRMIKLTDYITGNIDTEYGKSPIVLTFDDGNANNIKVTGLDENGNIIIDPNSAVGVLEEFKKKYPDFNVTAIFFIHSGLFQQPEYNEKIMKWLVDNGYEVGNHTLGHNNLKNTSTEETQKVVGGMYQKLEEILGDKYSKIIALPYGNPTSNMHPNYPYVVSGEYNGFKYETLGAMRVGWEPEVSSYNKDFNPLYIKRCRAYDNNGVEFDIEMVFKMLDKTRYISDGNANTIVTNNVNHDIIKTDTQKELILYE